VKRTLCLIATLTLLVLPDLFGADKRARTEDGKDMILRDDGTWHYVEEAKKDKKTSDAYKGKRGTFALYLTPGVWKKSEKPSNPVVEVEFIHKDGDVVAMVIAERISIPLTTLKTAAIEYVRRVDKEAKILEEGKRTVNGSEVLFLTINAKAQGIPFTYMYYLYSGEEGSIQIITFTSQNLFKEYRPDMEAFLNGFEVIKKEINKIK
jgi:hypothetical protein